MKYLLAALAFVALTTTSLAFDKAAYKADKEAWHEANKQAKEDWKNSGQVGPKPVNDPSTKPQKSLY